MVFAVPLLYWGGAAGLTLALPTLTELAICAVVAGISYEACQLANDPKLWAEMGKLAFPIMNKLPFPGYPEDLASSSDWTETTHPEQGKRGHREFINAHTGDRVRWDEGRPGATGHEGHDHYHWFNPDSQGKEDKYLDENGIPCAKGSGASHLYAPEGAERPIKGE